MLIHLYLLLNHHLFNVLLQILRVIAVQPSPNILLKGSHLHLVVHNKEIVVVVLILFQKFRVKILPIHIVLYLFKGYRETASSFLEFTMQANIFKLLIKLVLNFLTGIELPLFQPPDTCHQIRLFHY